MVQITLDTPTNKSLRIPRLSSLKWISFITLILQASVHTICCRYSRIINEKSFIPSTAVLFAEILKFFISTFVHVFRQKSSSLTPVLDAKNRGVARNLYIDVFGPDSDYLVMIVPAILYFVQNILNYWAATFLDPSTLQITSQLKLLTTAMFSVLLLGTEIPISKWILLAAIVSGIVIIQIPGFYQESNSNSNGYSNRFLGVLCVVASSCTSGFAGIWFEKCLKGKDVSLWLRNIQLSLFSIVPGFLIGGIYNELYLITCSVCD